MCGKAFADRKSDGIFDTNILTKEACKTCWAKYHCGGGCYAASYKIHHDIHQVDEVACEILKKRLEYALMLKIVESKKVDYLCKSFIIIC